MTSDDKIDISLITDEAYVIVHARPEGLRPEDSNVQGGAIGAHCFGPFFTDEEVQSWLDSPDDCLKFVLPLRAVRAMMAGDLDKPPSERLAEVLTEDGKLRLKTDARN